LAVQGLKICFGVKTENGLTYAWPSVIITRRMYWRRVSIQDGQAFTSAWWRHCYETVFRDNFVIFSSQIEKNSIFGISEFFYVSICKFSIFVMVTWPLFGTPQGLYLPHAVTDSPD